MKHLIIYNHLGVKELDLEVFVDGVDFEWVSHKPTAYWLGKLMLVDKEPEAEAQVWVVSEPELKEPYYFVEVHAIEPKTAYYQSAGDEGSGEAEQLESFEITPDGDNIRNVTKGNKRHRQSKTSSNTVGGRTKQRASTSRRGKTKETDVREV